MHRKANQAKRGTSARGISLKISHEDYALLRQMARKNNRPIVWQFREILKQAAEEQRQ